MPWIQNCAAADIPTGFHVAVGDNAMLIQITDPASWRPIPKHNFKEVHHFEFLDVEEKDHVRNFQPPVTGELIMATFGIGPCNEIGVIKTRIKEAILEGEIPNELEKATELMLKFGQEMGLKLV